MWMSLMCRTFSGDEPGESTGMVASRTTKALRSISDAYPIPATIVPIEAAAVVFTIAPVEAAAMYAAYCQRLADTQCRLTQCRLTQCRRVRQRPITPAGAGAVGVAAAEEEAGPEPAARVPAL